MLTIRLHSLSLLVSGAVALLALVTMGQQPVPPSKSHAQSVTGPLVKIPIPWSHDWMVTFGVNVGTGKSAFGKSATLGGELLDLTLDKAVARSESSIDMLPFFAGFSERTIEFKRCFKLPALPGGRMHRLDLKGILEGHLEIQDAADDEAEVIARVIVKDCPPAGPTYLSLLSTGNPLWAKVLPPGTSLTIAPLPGTQAGSVMLPAGDYEISGLLFTRAQTFSGSNGQEAWSDFFTSGAFEVCPELFAPVKVFCTAGTSASGCKAQLSASGSPSATAASGFDITASGVEGQKDGLLFFGSNGPQANSWGTSTSYQCVVPPVTRAGLLTGSGTNGLCDGSFSQDFNALWTAKPAKNPGEGATVQAQLWYRDPFNTSNQTTSLSDAIEFVVGP